MGSAGVALPLDSRRGAGVSYHCLRPHSGGGATTCWGCGSRVASDVLASRLAAHQPVRAVPHGDVLSEHGPALAPVSRLSGAVASLPVALAQSAEAGRTASRPLPHLGDGPAIAA